MSARSPYLRLLVLLGLWVATSLHMLAADASVSATLTRRSTEVGGPVQLQIAIEGATGRNRPPEVNVEGLDVRYLGPSSSQQIQMINGQIISHVTTVHVYQVTPTRAGDFIIPALNVDVDGKTYQTQPMSLKVEKASVGNSGDSDKIAFAEIKIPKRTAYIGEVLPVELNFYIAAPRWDLEQMPELSGEGFTKQKMPETRKEPITKNGREMEIVPFRTAITPSKAGKVTVGPWELSVVAQVPQTQGPQKRRGPRDPFGLLFDDPAFGGGLSAPRRFKVEAAAVELDVKPLPVEGRPPDFSGAVGQFKFTVEGSPNRVKIGDPVTMKMKITGNGSFDRIQAPALIDPTGWHAYPAADDFQPGDDLKTTGTKTFEMPVVPEVAHKQMPQFRFTFFDPAQGKYVTQTSPPIPLIVEGASPPAPAPAAPKPVASEGEPDAPKPAASATPSPTDILGLRYERGPRAMFAPLYTQRGFLLAQLLPLGIAAALLGARFLRKDSHAVRLDGMRRERERLWQKLRAEADAAAFYDLAARVVQFDTAIGTDLEPTSIDAATARRSRELDADTSAGIDEIFSARAELLYAGSGPVRTTLATADRQRVFTMLERFAKSHA